jgi:pimeloyl-ACP methyl ester carboxylesterase
MAKARELGPEGGARRLVVESDDGAQLYVESRGSGRPLLLVHGWTMSRRYWREQFGLAGEFQVVTPDLRAHGRSSKVLHGHTLPRYARDLAAVVEALGLEGVVLAGWSLSGPLVLEYWRQTGGQKVAALALVEMSPYPLGPPEWNTHKLAGEDLAGMGRTLRALDSDREAFGRRFIAGMFHQGRAPAAEAGWMLEEHLACPTPAALACYSDYLLRDLSGVLPQVSAPALVAVGSSSHICFGPVTGRHVAGLLPRGRLAVFPRSGHMPFLEEPRAFNRALTELAAEAG